MSTGHFTLDVVGQTWGGFESAYSYPILPNQAAALIECGTNASRFAGDFRSVTDWRVREVVMTYTRGRNMKSETRTDHVRRNWKDRNNGRKFARLTGGF